MAKVNVDFTVKPGTGVLGYWIAVGDQDVGLQDGKGTTQLESGETAVLIWWFVGNPGSKVGIVGKVGQRVIVEVKESKVPQGETQGSGFKRFTP